MKHRKKKDCRKLTIHELWSNFKKSNKCVVVVSKGEKVKGKLKIFEEIMVEDIQY